MINVGQVGMISIDSIDISDRARKEMGDLSSIENSIKERGLISPLAVKQLDNGRYLLLAGERRYTVLKKNSVSEIPVRIFQKDLSDIEIKSIELAENLYRKDFEYWESDALVKEIHNLQQQIHGVKSVGPSTEGWSTENTGEILGVSKASISTAIKRAEAREAFPELFKDCKTQSDASKVIKRIDEIMVKEEIDKKLESTRSDNYINRLANSFVIGDFFQGVKQIPDGIMHLVEIDPPYAIDLNNAKKKEGVSIYNEESYNEVDKEQYQIFLSRLFSSCYRVMADHSWLICWFAPEPWFEIVYRELNNAGFSTTRMCGVWTKPSGQARRPEMHLANTYEMFFYAWKGRPALNKQGRSNNFIFPPVNPQVKIHPTERPIELMEELYNTFTFKGSRVLIPFLGSGNGLIAATNLGMSPIGFELGKSYKDSFLVRLYKSNQFV